MFSLVLIPRSCGDPDLPFFNRTVVPQLKRAVRVANDPNLWDLLERRSVGISIDHDLVPLRSSVGSAIDEPASDGIWSGLFALMGF
jgi:hypothetical protein